MLRAELTIPYTDKIIEFDYNKVIEADKKEIDFKEIDNFIKETRGF